MDFQLTEEQKSRQDQMNRDVERLRKELARVRSINAIFKDIEKEYDSSILLIFTTYDLVVDQSRVTRASCGTSWTRAKTCSGSSTTSSTCPASRRTRWSSCSSR